MLLFPPFAAPCLEQSAPRQQDGAAGPSLAAYCFPTLIVLLLTSGSTGPAPSACLVLHSQQLIAWWMRSLWQHGSTKDLLPAWPVLLQCQLLWKRVANAPTFFFFLNSHSLRTHNTITQIWFVHTGSYTLAHTQLFHLQLVYQVHFSSTFFFPRPFISRDVQLICS